MKEDKITIAGPCAIDGKYLIVKGNTLASKPDIVAVKATAQEAFDWVAENHPTLTVECTIVGDLDRLFQEE